MVVAVNPKRCPQNHPCPAVECCPVKALSQKSFQAPELDAVKCIHCQKCVVVCPMGALRVY